MLCELWLSQRYLKKNRGGRIISLTAFISIAGIAIGVAVLIVVIAVMSGFDQYLHDKLVGTHSHITMEFYEGYRQDDVLMDELKKIPHITAVAPFVAGQAFMRVQSRIIALEMRGIDPLSQTGVSKIEEYTSEGSFDVRGREVIIGKELALRLGLDVGDRISLVSPVSLSMVEFVIKGVFKSGMYLYDSGLVLTSIEAAQEFFGMKDALSGIGIKIDDIYRAETVKNAIYANVNYKGLYEVLTWIDSNRNFLNALKLEKIVMFIVVTMTTVVAAFGIVSTLIMSVMSKIRDIGILRALGAKAGNIVALFIFQGTSLGIVGIVLGLISGVTLALSLNKIIDFISNLIGRSLIPKDIYYFDRIPTYFNAMDLVLIVVCALIISIAASVYPAYYASRINTVEAIRHE